MKKILVIDGNSIINRAFYGVRPLTTKSGKNTNAIYGMMNIVKRHLDHIKPDYAVVAFDIKAPTFRHKMYDAYKAGRHATPPELLEQFADAKECLSYLGFHVLTLEGYEADDIQGTVAKLAEEYEDVESYILSGDRDLLQLISDKVTVLLATNADTIPMHREQFVEKYGIEPEYFVEMKALMGDSSDNIPGVGGVGEKTAGNLIREFSTLEGIYENIEDKRISRGVREKLLRDRENAFLSRTLARIDTKAPIPYTLEELSYKGISRGELYQKFIELELNSLIAKFGLHPDDVISIKTPKTTTQSAKGGESMQTSFFDVFPEEASVQSVIKETVIDVCEAEEIFSRAKDTFAIRLDEDGKVCVCFGEETYRYMGERRDLAPLFMVGRKCITFDGKHLLRELAKDGFFPTRGITYLDLMLYGYVISPGTGTSSLSSFASQFLDGVYSEPVALCALFPLEEAMRKRIADDKMTFVLDEIELPLMPILAEMEETGFLVDTKGLTEFGVALSELMTELQEKIHEKAGGPFNINSPKQLGEVLFEKLGLSSGKKKTKTGYSTSHETLEELRGEHPIIEDILEYRQVSKLYSTYATALVEVADREGRIHTEFKQALTATGRLSSADPNLQNIPIRTKMGRQMRKYFKAREGFVLVDADYSQIELRLLAHISDDYTMCEAFREGRDIHRMTAAAVFGLPEEMIDEDLRKRAKAVNFGIVYGISGFSLAKDIGTSVAEATRYIKNYMMNYPNVEAYLEDVVAKATADGYTTTLYGRRRYIPELRMQNFNLRSFGKRIAMNAPIQGSAADIMKLAMIAVHRRLSKEGLEARLVMQVHDELIIEAPMHEEKIVRELLREEMENAVKLSIALTVDVTSGENWLDQQ